MSLRSKELVTVNVEISTTSGIVGGAVPAGMKRWVTFLSIDSRKIAAGGSAVGVYLASVGISDPTKASIIATSNRKAFFHLRGTQTSGMRKPPLTIPKHPSVDNPLFSIAAGKWMGVYATGTSSMIQVQYFDE